MDPFASLTCTEEDSQVTLAEEDALESTFIGESESLLSVEDEQNVVCSQRRIPRSTPLGKKRTLRSEETLVDASHSGAPITELLSHPGEQRPVKRVRFDNSQRSPSPDPGAPQERLAILKTRVRALEEELEETLCAIEDLEGEQTEVEIVPKVVEVPAKPKSVAQAKKLFIWLDMETTDAEHKYEDIRILEIAARITDAQFVPLDKGVSFLIHQEDIQKTLRLMSYKVKQMHTNNNLLSKLTDPEVPKVSLAEAEKQLCQYLHQHKISKDGILAGAGVHYDRNLVRYQMPKLNGLLFRSVLDTTAFWNLAHMRLGRPTRFPVKTPHRSMADLNGAIGEMKMYCKTMIKEDVKWS